MHDGGLPACPTSTQPRECEIAKTRINRMKNVPKRHVHYTIIKIDLAWTTNTIIVDDFGALCLTHCAGLIFDVSGIFFCGLAFRSWMAAQKIFSGHPTWYFLVRFCLRPRLLIHPIRKGPTPNPSKSQPQMPQSPSNQNASLDIGICACIHTSQKII